MSQYPPAGPSDDEAPSGEPPTTGTPDEVDGKQTEVFAQSPYDVPEGGQPSAESAYPAASYGQAPDPGRTIYSEASTVDPPPEQDTDGGRPRWLVPVVVAVIALLVAGGIVAALLLGGDDEEPETAPPPTVEPTVELTTTPAPTEETTSPQAPTAEPTTEPPTTPEATEQPTGELLADLEDAVALGDVTFELAEPFQVDEGLLSQGATEALRGTFVSGDEEIGMLATLWASNEEADEFAARIIDGLEGVVEVETGDTFTNGMGTYWAFASEDRTRGVYVWTTDRGHVLEVVGGADYLAQFYSNHPL